MCLTVRGFTSIIGMYQKYQNAAGPQNLIDVYVGLRHSVCWDFLLIWILFCFESVLFCIYSTLYQPYSVSVLHCFSLIPYLLCTVSALFRICSTLYQPYSVSTLRCINLIPYLLYAVPALFRICSTSSHPMPDLFPLCQRKVAEYLAFPDCFSFWHGLAADVFCVWASCVEAAAGGRFTGLGISPVRSSFSSLRSLGSAFGMALSRKWVYG